MISGMINTKHILLHPFRLIKDFGFKNFLHFLIKALSPTQYQFLPLVFCRSIPSNVYPKERRRRQDG